MIRFNRHDMAEFRYRLTHHGTDFRVELRHWPAGSDESRHHRWNWLAKMEGGGPPPIPVETGWHRWRWQAQRAVQRWMRSLEQ